MNFHFPRYFSFNYACCFWTVALLVNVNNKFFYLIIEFLGHSQLLGSYVGVLFCQCCLYCSGPQKRQLNLNLCFWSHRLWVTSIWSSLWDLLLQLYKEGEIKCPLLLLVHILERLSVDIDGKWDQGCGFQEDWQLKLWERWTYVSCFFVFPTAKLLLSSHSEHESLALSLTLLVCFVLHLCI